MKNAVILFLLCQTLTGFSQMQSDLRSEYFNILADVEIQSFKYSMDVSLLEKTTSDSAMDIGVAEVVAIDFINQSTSFMVSNGSTIYRMKIIVDNALAVGVDFSDFIIPDDGEFYVYDEEVKTVYGAFTSKNNKSNGRFSIREMPGNSIILEYIHPPKSKLRPIIKLMRVGKYYRAINAKVAEESNPDVSCVIDVHCEPNLEVERSVMKWKYYDNSDNKYHRCSCSMVNQDVASNDLKPYVLTANHCGKNADLSTAIFYFNYQNSFCGGSNAAYNYTMTGATMRSRRAIYDMYLMELNSFPTPDFNVHLAGWARYSNSTLTDNMMGVSHPHGEPKTVSLGTKQSNSNPNFWRVQWGVNFSPTLPGSSGSPLYERNNNLTIGWLSYGVADCSDPSGIERYGKLKDAWDGPHNDKKLKTWLDPNDNGSLFLLGRDPCFNDVLIHDKVLYSAQQRYQPENKVTIQAGNELTTSGYAVVKNNAFYKFTAGNRVVLRPGFHAQNGCDFIARIEGCDQVAYKALITQMGHETKDHDELKGEFNLFPIPTSGFLTLNIHLMKPQTISIKLIDLKGVNVKLGWNDLEYRGIEGINEYSMDVSDIPNGVYFILLTTDEYVVKKRIIKLE